MAPEYGATMGFFPVDERTIDYFEGTGRSKAEIDAFESYFRAQGLFGVPKAGDDRLHQGRSTLDLDKRRALAGRARSGRRTASRSARSAPTFADLFSKPTADNGFNQPADKLDQVFTTANGLELRNGDVLIAAITSCTNTSNPGVLLAAGLLAKKAVEAGLKVRKHIKTSLAPGSRVVTEYLEKRRAAALPGEARLLGGGLRLHHLHRQRRRSDAARSTRRSPRTTWSAPRCCRATGTSRRASTRT